MNTRLLIAIGYFICLSAIGQDKIEGVGKFKVGQSAISLVDEIAKEYRTDIKTIDSQRKIDNGSYGRIVEVIPNKDDPKKSPDRAHLCPNIRVFLIRRYVISDILFENIYLTFFDDRLIYFSCKGSSAIDDALQVKYGKPEFKTETKPSSGCNNSLDKTYKKEWENGDIVASSYLSSSRRFDCREFLFYSFSISDTKLYTNVKPCDENIEEVDNSKKKKNLKDL